MYILNENIIEYRFLADRRTRKEEAGKEVCRKVLDRLAAGAFLGYELISHGRYTYVKRKRLL